MNSFIRRNAVALVIGGALLFIALVWLSAPAFVGWRAAKFESPPSAEADASPESLLSRAGQYGDLYGAANALFTGLALFGTVIAILLQTRELKLQREELKLQRDEMSKSNEQRSYQNEILRDQAATAKADRDEAEERRRKASWPIFVFRMPRWTNADMGVQVTNYENAGIEVVINVLDAEIKCDRKVEEIWQESPQRQKWKL